MRKSLQKTVIYTMVSVFTISCPYLTTIKTKQVVYHKMNYPLAKLLTSANKPDSLIKYSNIVFDLLEKSESTGKPALSPNSDVILQGGDDCFSATIISDLPFTDVGTTIGYTDDYDEVCPYEAVNAPDVVYSFTPDDNGFITISLCTDLTDYDTKLYVYEDVCQSPFYACNDDECTSTNYPDNAYISEIRYLEIFSGHTYYIVIDGYSGESGTYELDMYWVVPQEIECPPEGIPEGEPACYDEYEDQFNGGCGSYPEPVFSYVNPGDIICGTSGTFIYQSSNYRDTDWYEYSTSSSEELTWKAVAEFPVLIVILDGTNGCNYMEVIAFAQANEYDTAEVSIAVEPGTYWMWIGPLVFEGFPCPANYVAWFDAGRSPLPYLPGDCTMALGLWPPSVIGGDVSYLVGYFIGSGNAPCYLDAFWASADVTGDCSVIGGDVSALVGFFIGSVPAILYCPDYPPAWLEGVPDDPPDGWPNCDIPVINSKVIPTGSVK